jgi:hypothetical protein
MLTCWLPLVCSPLSQAEEDGKEVELREVRALADQLAAKVREG